MKSLCIRKDILIKSWFGILKSLVRFNAKCEYYASASYSKNLRSVISSDLSI